MDPIEDAILRLVRTIRTAYDEGLEAGRLNRQPHGAQAHFPYTEDSAEYVHWMRGFEEATRKTEDPARETVSAER